MPSLPPTQSECQSGDVDVSSEPFGHLKGKRGSHRKYCSSSQNHKGDYNTSLIKQAATKELDTVGSSTKIKPTQWSSENSVIAGKHRAPDGISTAAGIRHRHSPGALSCCFWKLKLWLLGLPLEWMFCSPCFSESPAPESKSGTSASN